MFCYPALYSDATSGDGDFMLPDMTSPNLLHVYQCFGGKYRPHLSEDGRNMYKEKSKHKENFS
jgi:hypothetical protein